MDQSQKQEDVKWYFQVDLFFDIPVEVGDSLNPKI